MFIVYEGMDNTGKTTQAKMLAKELLKITTEENILLLKEPGGSLLSQQMRQIIAGNPSLSPRTQGALFLAGMYNTYTEIIHPALEAGKIVVLDRYTPSTYAYQVHANGLSEFVPLISIIPPPDLWFYTYNELPEEKKRASKEDMDEVGWVFSTHKDRIKDAYNHMFIKSNSDFILRGIPTFVNHNVRTFNVEDDLSSNVQKAMDVAEHRYFSTVNNKKEIENAK
jgi:dTMP kinase